jgi:hypothetical protein
MDVGAKTRYPGAQPFTDNDLSRKLFRGREREASALSCQIVAHRLVLLFARSGVGKTSLLNAGIAEMLRSQGFLPLAVRLNDTILGPLESLYRGIASASARQQMEYVSGQQSSLWLFFKTAEFWYQDNLLTPVLILDQFEEIFTLQPEERRAELVQQLSYLIRGVRPPNQLAETVPVINDMPPKVHIVISMREDFLPLLEEIADRIPAILDQRFRLKPLEWDAASRALEEPAGVEDKNLVTKPFNVESNGRDAILQFLARRAPASILKSSSDIEPFQLQLICQYIEEIAQKKQLGQPRDRITITLEDITQGADLQKILEEFYDRQIHEVSSFRKRQAVRRLCAEFLVSPDGRRLRMEEGEIERLASVSPETLRMLVDRRLLRSDKTPEATYYELSHDSLIKAVLASKRLSFAFRAAVYFGLGSFGFGFGFMSIIIGLVWPFSPRAGEDGLDTVGSAIMYLGFGLILCRGGASAVIKFREMKRRFNSLADI